MRHPLIAPCGFPFQSSKTGILFCPTLMIRHTLVWRIISTFLGRPPSCVLSTLSLSFLGRPWTPQAFYRLALYYSCHPVLCAYVVTRLPLSDWPRYDTSWLWRLFFIPAWIWGWLTRYAGMQFLSCGKQLVALKRGSPVTTSNPDLLVTAWWKAIGWACYIALRKPKNVSGTSMRVCTALSLRCVVDLLAR